MIYKKNGTSRGNGTQNYFHIIGTAVRLHKITDEVVRIQVATTTMRNETHVCYPNIVFYGKDAVDAIMEAIQIKPGETKPRIDVEGYIQTVKRENDEGTAYFQDFIGEEISFARNPMEELLKVDGIGKAKAYAVNEVALVGELIHKHQFPSGQQVLTLKTFANGHMQFPKVFPLKSLGEACDDLEIGDLIAVLGTVFTSSTEQNGRNVFRESVFVHDLHKM